MSVLTGIAAMNLSIVLSLDVVVATFSGGSARLIGLQQTQQISIFNTPVG